MAPPKGPTGPTGPTGEAGSNTGIVGPTGPRGMTGAVGPPGVAGTSGPVRVSSQLSQLMPTPNVDMCDQFELTSQMTNADFQPPTGTPATGQQLLILIVDNGTARNLSWSAAYVAQAVPLPTVTVPGRYLYVVFIYTTANGLNKWLCLATTE